MSKNILLVYHVADALKSFKWVFKDETYYAFVFDHPSEALKIMEGIQFDLVIFIQSLPETDGLEFLQKVKLKFPDTTGIIMGCSNDLEEVANIVRLGYDYIIVEKPWDTKKLQKAVEMAVVNYKSKVASQKVFALTSDST